VKINSGVTVRHAERPVSLRLTAVAHRKSGKFVRKLPLLIQVDDQLLDRFT